MIHSPQLFFRREPVELAADFHGIHAVSPVRVENVRALDYLLINITNLRLLYMRNARGE